jgi:hypothetical protein
MKIAWHKTTYQFNLGACFVKYRAEKGEKNSLQCGEIEYANNRI